jgi:hypothetical protein
MVALTVSADMLEAGSVSLECLKLKEVKQPLEAVSHTAGM